MSNHARRDSTTFAVLTSVEMIARCRTTPNPIAGVRNHIGTNRQLRPGPHTVPTATHVPVHRDAPDSRLHGLKRAGQHVPVISTGANASERNGEISHNQATIRDRICGCPDFQRINSMIETTYRGMILAPPPSTIDTAKRFAAGVYPDAFLSGRLSRHGLRARRIDR